MKRMNLIGERFGNLTVIDRATVQDGKNYRWLCLCDCGNQCEVTTCHLRSGHTRSCGRCQTFIEEGKIVKCVLPDGGSFILTKQIFLWYGDIRGLLIITVMFEAGAGSMVSSSFTDCLQTLTALNWLIISMAFAAITEDAIFALRQQRKTLKTVP